MGELVQLRRHYEVIFVQALDLLRLQRDRGVSPAEADVGVVTFSFGEVANTLRKGKRLGKILELEGSLDPSILIAYCPCGSLAAKSFYCVFIEWGDTATARRARLAHERIGLCRHKNRLPQDIGGDFRESHLEGVNLYNLAGLGKPGKREDLMAAGDKLTLGELWNSATSMTRLVGNVDHNCVFRVEQEDAVNAAEAIVAIGGPGRGAISGYGGTSASDKGGFGLAGQGGKGVPNDVGGVGVLGSGGGPSDNRGDGVWGVTNSPGNAGVFGFNFGVGPAVRGYSAVVTGQRPSPTGNGVGVEGKSGGGKGVHGAASAEGGIGVLAEHTGSGRGLAVRGRAGFSTCGNDTVAAGRKSKTVSNPAVTAKSHITVSLTSDPGSAQLLWVQRQAGSFTVHLTSAVSNATSFSYLIVEPFP